MNWLVPATNKFQFDKIQILDVSVVSMQCTRYVQRRIFPICIIRLRDKISFPSQIENRTEDVVEIGSKKYALFGLFQYFQNQLNHKCQSKLLPSREPFLN